MSGNLWSDMINAQVFDKGNPLKPGVFDLVVTRCLQKDTFKRGMAFIVEFDVIDSSNPEQPPGTSVSWYQGLSANRAVALNMVFGFLLPVLGFDMRAPGAKERAYAEIRPMTPRIMTYATSEENGLAGLLIHADVVSRPYTDKQTHEQKDGTDLRWECFDYEGRGVQRPDIAALLARANGYGGGGLTRPPYGAGAPAFGPPAGPPPGFAPPPPKYPPGTVFHPAGTSYGAGATHYWSGSAWLPV